MDSTTTLEQSSRTTFMKPGERVMMKVCDSKHWLVIGQKELPNGLRDPTLSVSGSGHGHFAPLLGRNRRLDPALTAPDLGSVLSLTPVPQQRGVNLGGWFIPEVWMNPSFFQGSGLGWGGSLCAMRKKYSEEVTEERMQSRLSTWITEEDFRLIKNMGFNSVRLPLGYWNLINDPYSMYAPADHSIAVKYIDFAFDMCDKYGLTLLLDLHGAPGSQNGQDHSGCGMEAAFLDARKMNVTVWDLPYHPQERDNIELALQAVGEMAARYGHRSCLLGIEILNEPGYNFESEQSAQLLQYYKDAYLTIRQYSSSALVIVNELFSEFYSRSGEMLQEPNFYNVVLDMHLYNWQAGEKEQESNEAHIRDAAEWGGVIQKNAASHPVMVGEFCMSTGTIRQTGQPFVDAEIRAYESSHGWYLWNWKLDRGIGFDEWDVQYQYYEKAKAKSAGSGTGSMVNKDGGVFKDMTNGLDPLLIYRNA